MADGRAQVHKILVNAHDQILRLWDGLDTSQILAATTNAVWNNKDTLAHLATIEPRERAKIECALAGKPYVSVDSIDAYNARMIDERRPWTGDQVRAEFIEQHHTTLRLFDELSDEQLERDVDLGPRGRMTVLEILRRLAEHIGRHAAEMTTPTRSRS